ncbi:MAG: MarR family winged helix-turn-helix transcriptional regulator [Promethearchaeota archaeon]
MGRDYRQTLDLFYIFLLRIKERIINKRPEILHFLVSNKFNIKRDPFGKYVRMINYIGERINPSMKDFSEYFNLNAGTATGIIDNLVDKKLILRVSNNRDRRKVELNLTELGELIYQKQKEIEENEFKILLDHLTDTELTDLVKILNKINSFLD